MYFFRNIDIQLRKFDNWLPCRWVAFSQEIIYTSRNNFAADLSEDSSFLWVEEDIVLRYYRYIVHDIFVTYRPIICIYKYILFLS